MSAWAAEHGTEVAARELHACLARQLPLAVGPQRCVSQLDESVEQRSRGERCKALDHLIT